MHLVKNCVYALQYTSYENKNNKEIILEAIKINTLCFKYASKELKNDIDFIIDCIIINKNIINYYKKNKLILLIYNLEHNYNNNLIILDELFLDNINYISKISHFYNILKYILDNYYQNFIDNYIKFIPSIINHLEYVQLCQDFNIHIFNINEATNNGEYDYENVKKEFELKYKIILWY